MPEKQEETLVGILEDLRLRNLPGDPNVANIHANGLRVLEKIVGPVKPESFS